MISDQNGDNQAVAYNENILPILDAVCWLQERYLMCKQGDHLSGKPGNVREFETCQGNVRDVVNSQGIVREKILSWKSVPKLFITTYLTLTPEVLATVYLNISISFKNST